MDIVPSYGRKKILSTKDINSKGPVAIMINLMKTPLLCTEDSHFTCNLG